MTGRRTLLGLVATGWGLLVACGDAATTDPAGVSPSGLPTTEEGPPPTPEPAATWVEGTTAKGTYRVRWRPAAESVPLNDYFELEVDLTRAADGAPVAGAGVHVRADMPAHGHGMNVVPAVREVGGGRYRAEGLLLHMRGHWKLGIDVIVEGTAESADFDLDLG